MELDTRGRNARCVVVLKDVVARPTTPSLTALLFSTLARSHIASSTGPPVFDDGREFSLVTLKGTVQITYNHANYNIPIEVVIPDQYPDSPPIVYVRPTPTMEIKPNHSVIDSNGNVNRLLYLSRWTNSHMHNLATLCTELSARFSAEPPLFSRPPGSAARGSSGSFTQTAQAGSAGSGFAGAARGQQQQQHTQSAYGQQQGASFTSSSNPYAAVSATSSASTNMGGAYRDSDRKEQLITRITEKLQHDLDERYNNLIAQKEKVEDRHERLKLNEKLVAERIEQGRKDLARIKTLSLDIQNEKMPHLERWIAELDAAGGAQQQSQQQQDQDFESYIFAFDPLSEQINQLEAEQWACDDAIKLLAEAFDKGLVPLDEFLRETREIASEQFKKQAHLYKIRGGGGGGASPRQ